MTADKVATLNSKLIVARRLLEQLTGQRDIYIKAAEDRHWTETDSAIGSGIRRKPNPRADAARYARYAREGKVFADHADAEKQVAVLEKRLTDAIAERDRIRFTREQLVTAVVIRDQFGWHKVAKVNPKTVSVETGYSWTDRIQFDDVLEYRSVAPTIGGTA